MLRVEHQPGAVSALVERIAGLEADPAEVRVVIETRHGLLVEALVEAGYTVLPVNPELVSRRRGPARKKDDADDARRPRVRAAQHGPPTLLPVTDSSLYFKMLTGDKQQDRIPRTSTSSSRAVAFGCCAVAYRKRHQP